MCKTKVPRDQFYFVKLAGSVAVARQALDLFVKVRILARQPMLTTGRITAKRCSRHKRLTGFCRALSLANLLDNYIKRVIFSVRSTLHMLGLYYG